ncbi:reactivating factor for adenosylcobalamine-dependent D-ornithine aminomutase [Fervidicella metallireducens AeB]|uniref:Reactivating factor for adenosylcobalamine-dependent D-ornithine aminomutase n=1 Tax=Fervidicella metallireducens AeB TaxID=1403537 RepID=A0A017RYB1_9CLOT|nr:GlmL-related ornithine degradation protein [Fervidicella metallireducens]EYE89652.1 reactivating factor for adenosylcobalamine-dependent D-ornithine aminomutase [Fervidicella metallireducens AeB]
MKIDVLVAEIGSTTTVVNAFNGIHTDSPKFIGQGQAPTTVLEGDVTVGLKGAIESLRQALGEESIEYGELLATSSAAGGLKMTVHGLVYDMTAKAAKEAALGAGAIIHMVTAGKLRRTDLKKIEDIKPNIILIAGGLDYGERDTAIENAEKIAELGLNIPIIYAGNCENQDEMREIFKSYSSRLYVVENVYPKVDMLNVEPTRRVIQEVFEEHIIHAPGMTKVRDMVTGPIIPTPGAVMEAAKLLKEEIGDLIVIDVGGATTDVHSVTEGSEEINRILLAPEPEAKRTVEGDLGVFVNMRNVVERIGVEKLSKELGFDVVPYIENHKPIPKTEEEIKFVERLTLEAVLTAVERHAGRVRRLYGESGKKSVAEGKDLTQVKFIIGTGGALTRLPKRVEIMQQITRYGKGVELLPKEGVKILVDNNYIMASLGVLSKEYKEASLKLMKESLGI